MKRLFVIEYDTTEGVEKKIFIAADDVPTLEQAQHVLAAGDDTDFTDKATYIWELGQVWSEDGDLYEIKLEEVTL